MLVWSEGQVRLVGLDGTVHAVLLEGADISGVAASPDGGNVAIAYGDPFAVVVFDIATGSEVVSVVAGTEAAVEGAHGGDAAPSVRLAMLCDAGSFALGDIFWDGFDVIDVTTRHRKHGDREALRCRPDTALSVGCLGLRIPVERRRVSVSRGRVGL